MPRPRGSVGVVARQEKELHSLLRRRLLIVVSVAVGFFGILPLGSIRSMFEPGVPETAFQVLSVQWMVAATVGLLGILIWKRPPEQLRHLRVFEMVIFAIIVSYIAVSTSYFIERFGVVTPPIGRARHPLLDMGATRLDTVTLRWLVVIVGYGTLIPNTWRRCATVVASMVTAHLGILLVQSLLEGVSLRELYPVMMYPVVWMIVGSVVAVFGSYRVHLLERRVQDAERLGQYRLRRLIGSGGMGEVYLAEHVLLKQPFAVKMLRPERVADPQSLQRFELEVQAMARLQHWNTVEIHDYGHAADGSFYYVMEYLAGQTLDQMVSRRGPMPPARVIYLIRQVCNALSEAHSIGLTHRDIKPGNILVCERAGIFDVAKLLDFGLVKDMKNAPDGITVDGFVAGTPTFMSPEQAAGSAHADLRSDIYSLGAVAYYLLTGKPPFVKKTSTQIMAAHIYEQPLPVAAHRPDIDPELDRAIQRCLAKKPADRFPDADSLAAALAACEDATGWTQTDAMEWWSGAEHAPTLA